MKKFLSLVLALTMALSLVTVSAGATDFDDDGDITYQEAVTVIAGMGIVDGYSDGSFRPDDVLTRGAAAKIICNLILGPTTADALSASSAPFVDVPTTNTFAGYITYCSQQGIISGYADGTFRPTDTLSGNAFMKMLLGALGYDSEREGYTGSNWTVNVIKQAVGIGLDDGNDDFVGSQAVTRQEACLYAFNTLKATMVEYSDNSTVTVGDITISSQGDYSDVTNGTSSDGNIEDDGLMQFAERYFRDLEAEDDTDDFGRPATKWVYDGDDLCTYANDADETFVVDDTEDSLLTLMTDGDCLNYSSSDINSDADVYFNGTDEGAYSSNRNSALAGKGDILEVYEDDNGDVDTIVIRSYTYAKIDTVDTDLSSTHENRGASVGIELVDIDDDSIGTYYNDYNDDDKILKGYNSDYTEGTVLAVAISAADGDVILDSYIMESVTGTPSAARAVDYSTNNDDQVAEGTITIDGTRYEYAGQMTGLDDGDEVDFDEEYTIYLTAEGYVLAVDGAATATLDDVYYVNLIYRENTRGRIYYYAEAVSIMDGTEVDVELDVDDPDCEFDISDMSAENNVKTVKDLYIMDVDDGTGELYRGQDGYSLSIGALHASVTSSSSTIRLDENTTGTYGLATYDDGDSIDTEDRFYLEDSTFFVGIDNATATSENNSSLDVSTATGTMAAKISSHNLKVFVIFRDGDSDAAFVVYAAGNLEGGASSEDVVYLADDAVNTVGIGNYEVNLYFVADMTLVEDVVVDDDYKQGFYAYEVDEDGVYTLTTDEVEFIDDDVNDDTDDEADESVAFVEVYNYLASTVSSGYFDAISFADAVVIDTRSSSDRNDDVYDNEINTASKLSTAIDRIMDDDIQDGEIVFVAVTDVADGEPDEDDGETDTDIASVVLENNGRSDVDVTLYNDDDEVINDGEEHDWALYIYTTGQGFGEYDSGDDYVYGQDNPWSGLVVGDRIYVVIDGVRSNTITISND